MKRLFLLVVAMSLCMYMAFANEDGLGLTVGAGFFEPNTDADADDDEVVPVGVLYEGTFMDEKLDVTAELIYTHPMDSKADGDIAVEVEGMYHFAENMAGILTLMVDNSLADNSDPTLWLAPGFRYKHTFGFGDLYARADVPLYLGMEENSSAMDIVLLKLTFNLMRLRDKLMTPGTWGAELGLDCILSEPTGNEDTMQSLTITPYYETELLYGEVEVSVPMMENGMKSEGMTITPLVDINIPSVKGLAAVVKVPISGLGADDVVTDPTKPNETKSAMTFGFGVGVKYSF